MLELLFVLIFLLIFVFLLKELVVFVLNLKFVFCGVSKKVLSLISVFGIVNDICSVFKSILGSEIILGEIFGVNLLTSNISYCPVPA